MNRFTECLKLVGNTPLVNYKANIYAKFEAYNPSGSIKDRIVFHIFNDAIKKEKIILNGDNKTTIIEASSGNTGISTAFISSILNIPCKIIMPEDMSKERKDYIKHFGAELIEVDAGDFGKAIELRDKLSIQNNWFNVNQFNNQLNIDAHYKTTGTEIINQFAEIDKIPDILITGAGTGGTIMGVSKRLKEINPKLRVVILEPAESPVMSGGKAGLHQIQGIGDGSKFLVDMNIVDNIETVKSMDAISKMKELHREGYFVGISAAANILVAEKYSLKYPNANIITFMCDRGDRYLSMIN
jgi:cysteine synthase A